MAKKVPCSLVLSQSGRAQTGAVARIPLNHSKMKKKRRALAQGQISELSSPLERTVIHFQEQLSLMHGVLEELCERQEALANWQSENIKRQNLLDTDIILALRALSDIQIRNGRVTKQDLTLSETSRLSHADDHLYEEALDSFEIMMDELKSRRIRRLEKTIETIRTHRSEISPVEAQGTPINDRQSHTKPHTQSQPESMLVIPSRDQLH